MEKAIKAGADILICPGFSFETLVYDVGTKNKDKSFVIIDSEPKDAEGNAKSVELALDKYAKNNNKLPEDCAGKTVFLGIEEDCVGLSATEGSWRMKNFTIDEYNKVYASMKKKMPVINGAKLPKLAYVKVSVQK